LFLGAGKRMSLFERVSRACEAEGVCPTLYTYEDSPNVPVAALATVVVGLPWKAPGFTQHLLSTVIRHNIQVVVPCMDAATVALSQVATSLQEVGCWPVVSDLQTCITFENKRLTAAWFLEHGVLTPVWQPDSPFPWIVKHVHGFGSRNQFIVDSRDEFELLKSKVDLNEYIVQPFVEGPEFTVDAYVSRRGQILGCVTRRRLLVVGGEVVNSVTERKDALIRETTRILSVGGFQGPVTFQAIQNNDDFWFIEGNLRFGGGVILSMEAGADYARLLVREYLGRPVRPVSWEEGVLMTRAYREVFHKGVKGW